MIGEGLIKKAVAGVAAAACAGVAVIALGFTLFYALCLVVVPVAAAAITFAVFAAGAVIVASVFLKGDSPDEDDGEEPESLVSRAVHLVRERPILGAAGGLGILFFLLRNPALAAIAASVITEKRMEQRGYGRRRR